MRNRKNDLGITIIALVVTIVVLLILAGITIASFTGDKGVLNETKDIQKNIGDLQNQTINDLHSIANELASSGGGALNPDNPTDPVDPSTPTGPTISDSSTSHTATEIDYTWEQISKIAEAIAKSGSVNNETMEVKAIVDGIECTIGVGDIATVKYKESATSEVDRQVRVLGFKHDDLVKTGVETYGEGAVGNKAGISFEFYDFITGDTYKSMNSSDTNSGGWAATQMRKDLNGYTTNDDAQSGAIGGEGANLSNKGYIKQVKKSYIKEYSNANSIYQDNDSTKGKNYTQDYLWLLACSEIVNAGYQANAYAFAITTEGSQYKYYQGVNKEWNAVSDGRKKYNASGSALGWWLRSPYYSYKSRFCFVSSSGNANDYNYASGAGGVAGGVAPGFAI